MTNHSKNRFVALDVLRGLTVAFMIIVNNPGTWLKVYPPLLHSSWNGCTPTDLVYPFFIFCMGVAMAFAFSRFDGLSMPAAKKVIKRSALIFLTGFLIQIFPFYPLNGESYLCWMQHWRIFGVLQRIALSYLIASLVVLGCRKDPGKVALVGLGLAALYTAILLVWGDLTLEGNAVRKIDIALFGENHLYQGYGIPFDPEGLLGSLTGACTAILGFFVGAMVKEKSTGPYLLAYGLCFLVAGKLLDFIIPINKPLWSASYVLYAGGWATLALWIISYLTDALNMGKLFVPAQAMGMNALLAFILSGIIPRLFAVFHWFPGRMYFSASKFTSFCYAVLMMLVIFCILWTLYKKKIVVKL